MSKLAIFLSARTIAEWSHSLPPCGAQATGECASPAAGGGEFEILHEGLAHFVGGGILWRNAGQAVDLLAAKRCGVLDRLAYAILELFLSARNRCDATLPGSPVTRRQVVQDLSQTMLCKALGQFLPLVGIGKQIFHSLEARVGGSFEAVQELDFVKRHGQIGIELRHSIFPSTSLSV